MVAKSALYNKCNLYRYAEVFAPFGYSRAAMSVGYGLAESVVGP
jgi:hypothetical protein